MTIDFTCQKCDSSFELDAEDLIDGTEKLVCPNCDAKTPASMTDDFVSAMVELRAQIVTLSKRFAVNMNLETEDLSAKPLVAEEEEEDETDEDEDDLDSDDEDEDNEEEDTDAGEEDER